MRPQCLKQYETTTKMDIDKLCDPVHCCGSSILSMVLVSDNGALPVSLASLTERPLAHCSSTDTLHCRWFPLSSRLQAENRESSACVDERWRIHWRRVLEVRKQLVF